MGSCNQCNTVKIHHNSSVKSKFSFTAQLSKESYYAHLLGSCIFFLNIMTNLIITEPKLVYYILNITAYLLLAYNVIFNAVKNIFQRKIFTYSVLLFIATLASFINDQVLEASGIMIFYHIGNFLKEKAIQRSNKAINILIQMKPTIIHLKSEDNNVVDVSPEEISLQDKIIVKPGETVPLDGIILQGDSNLNMSNITGESFPISVSVGDNITSGAINLDNTLEIQVSKVFTESTFHQILKFVESSQKNKPVTEELMNRFSNFYTPFIFFISLLLLFVPPVFFNGDWSIWINRSIILLAASCPCALVLSIPLSFSMGVSFASQYGVLFKNTNTIENLTKLNKIVFDKTGTITESKLKVQQIISHSQVSEKELLNIVVGLEQLSTHPVAYSIIQYFQEQYPNEKLPASFHTQDTKEIKGEGIIHNDKNSIIVAGNIKLMEQYNIEIPSEVLNLIQSGIHIFIAKDNILIGSIILNDTLKQSVKESIQFLNKKSIQTAIISGDQLHNVKDIAQQAQIHEYYHNVSPLDKVKKFQDITQKSSMSAFVGDGVNDAPVLSIADIGIAMGQGSDLATASSEIIIHNNNIYHIIYAYKIAKKTIQVVKVNMFLAITTKMLFIILGGLGIVSIWSIMSTDIIVSLFTAFYSLKIKSMNFQ